MLNFYSLNAIRVIASKNDYEIVLLGFKNHIFYYITFLDKPIYRYTSLTWAKKRYFNLVFNLGVYNEKK